MKTINLPDELNVSSASSVAIYNYKSVNEISKQQILLNKNTFSFLQEGIKEVFSDNSSYVIDNSQFLLMKSGHCLMTEKLSNADASYKSILFFFSNEAVLNFMLKYNLSSKKTAAYYSTYAFHYDAFIKRFVASLLDILKLPKATQQNILDLKFEEIMLYLVEVNGIDFLYAIINNNDDKQQQFIQAMESNKLNKLTLKELSFLTNMSISTFKRVFEKHFHSSPSKWFQEKRLEHAALLLKSTSKRPSDIYDEIGYETLSNFIQAFKLKYGITPKQYQES